MSDVQAFPGIIGSPGHGNSAFFAGPNGDNIPIEFSQGMTLRDYFAGQALNGLLACNRIHEMASPVTSDAIMITAQWSYRCADSMMRARDEKGGA